MAINKDMENTLGSIDSLRGQVYDKLLETITQNIDKMDKQQLLNIFSEFVQDIKYQNRDLVGGILEAGNENLAMGYAYATRNHIERVDKTIDSELMKVNSQPSIAPTDLDGLFR